MDLLAAIAADPMLLPLWAVLLFAAGMYPVGMMFGCTPCCSQDPCVCASGSTLPETITVTLDGFTDYSKKQLCTLSFSACYGSGGSGTVDAPGQSSPESDPEDDRGPIAAVSLTDGGSGYAKLGRVAPTVSVTGTSGSGTGATFNVTLASSKDSCGLDRWVVKSVSQTGGTGYATGDQLQFTVAAGDTVETAATAVFAPQYGEPTLTLSVSGGTGGVLTIDGYNKLSAGSDAYYGIGSVTVANGGSGYADNTQATITLGTGDEKLPSSATPVIRIRTEYRPPNDEWTLQQYDTNTWEPIPTIGTGLVISLTLAPDYAGSTDYEAASVAVVAGGSGYTVGEWFTAAAVEGVTEMEAELEITSVGSGGEVTGIELWLGGRFAGIDTGVIDRVEFGLGGWRGAYRKLLSSSGITVTNGGAYYREDASLPPYVAAVTVNISQGYNTPSAGTGAVITATVEDDPQSPDFGVITGLAVQNGGDGYLAWVWETNDCCGHYLNGQSIVLERVADSNATVCNLATVPFSPGSQHFSVPVACVYTHRFCGGWKSPFLTGPAWFRTPQARAMQLYVGFNGEGQPAVAKLDRACGAVSSDDNTAIACVQEWISDENIATCSQFQWSGTNSSGTSIAVAPGGQYEPEWRFVGCESTASASCQSCNVCCQGSDDPPEEIEIQWADEWAGLSLPGYGQVIAPRPNNLADTSGTYVLQKFSATRWAGNFQHLAFDVGTTPGICGCVGYGCCEECIKKCSVHLFGMRIGTSYTTGQADNFLSDERFGSYGQYNFANCSVCNETPMCRPPPGLEIPIIVERIIVPLGFFFSRAGTITFQ